MFRILHAVYFIGETFLLFYIQFSRDTRAIAGADGTVSPLWYLLAGILLFLMAGVGVKGIYGNWKDGEKIAGRVVLELVILALPFLIVR